MPLDFIDEIKLASDVVNQANRTEMAFNSKNGRGEFEELSNIF